MSLFIAGSGKAIKLTLFLLLTRFPIAGQVPGGVIHFDPADGEHCRVVTIERRSMRQTTFGGTSVAIGSPASTPDGEFRVFVAIRRTGEGKARVEPGEFSAFYSDSEHTRFSFHDIAAEIDARRMREAREESNSLALNSVGDSRTQSLDASGRDRVPNVRRRSRGNLNGPARETTDANEKMPGSAAATGELYLRGVTLQQGTYASGIVYFRKPRRSKVKIGQSDALYEVDIPVNGVVFRFR